mmetsp:Transcript_140062/g.364066  ORF Transcript_140062/g.364066 Transcript_140062/m.364066 type:complete len:200 (-) Transcript_140062:159-758(-)
MRGRSGSDKWMRGGRSSWTLGQAASARCSPRGQRQDRRFPHCQQHRRPQRHPSEAAGQKERCAIPAHPPTGRSSSLPKEKTSTCTAGRNAPKDSEGPIVPMRASSAIRPNDSHPSPQTQWGAAVCKVWPKDPPPETLRGVSRPHSASLNHQAIPWLAARHSSFGAGLAAAMEPAEARRHQPPQQPLTTEGQSLLGNDKR